MVVTGSPSIEVIRDLLKLIEVVHGGNRLGNTDLNKLQQ